MHMLDLILFMAVVAIFLCGVWVGGIYGGIQGGITEIKRWLKEKVS